MTECYRCGSTEDLENWANYTFCKKCADINRDYWKKAPQTEGNNIKIKTSSEVDYDAQYDPSNGAIVLATSTEDPLPFCVWIQHEVTHSVLHRLMGIQCCFQWDNISKYSEIEWETMSS